MLKASCLYHYYFYYAVLRIAIHDVCMDKFRDVFNVNSEFQTVLGQDWKNFFDQQHYSLEGRPRIR